MKLSVVSLAAAIALSSATPLLRRDDFPVETVTATISGKATTFAHTVQVAASTDSVKREELKLSNALRDDLQKFLTSPPPAIGNTKRSDSGIRREVEPSAVHRRQNPTTFNPGTAGMALNNDMIRRVQFIIENMGPGGRFAGLVMAVQGGGQLVDGVHLAFAQSVMNPLYALGASLPDLKWIPEAILRKAVDTAVTFAMMVQNNIELAADVFIDQSQYVEDKNSKVCPVGDQLPWANNPKCSGFNGQCTKGDMNDLNGCTCRQLVKLDPLHTLPWSSGDAWISEIDALAKAGFVGGGGSGGGHGGDSNHCLGTTTNTWVTRDAAANAITDWCKGGHKASGVPSGDLQSGKYSDSKRYNEGTPDDVTLKITYYANMEIDEATCVKLLRDQITDGCDGNDRNNPGNVKHGGTYDLKGGQSGGAVLSVTPNRGDDVLTCYTVSSGTWLDARTLENNVKLFCADMPGTPGNSPMRTFNSGTFDVVELSVQYPSGVAKTESDCLKAMNTMLTSGCDGNDPTNFLNFKHGGEVIIGGKAKYKVVPKSNHVIKDGSGSGSLTADGDQHVYKGTVGQKDQRLDKATVQGCLNDLWTDPSKNHWLFVPEVNCYDMVTIYRGLSNWNSMSDCMASCINQISQAVEDGYTGANCDAYAGVSGPARAHCWMGIYLKK